MKIQENRLFHLHDLKQKYAIISEEKSFSKFESITSTFSLK